MKRIPMFGGGIERRKEECRDAFGGRMLDTLRRDGKHAMRRLVKDWQFSAGAVVILALGIGANTAVFSLLNNTLVGNTRSIDMVADAPKKFFYRSATQAGVMPTTLVARGLRDE
ncbi:MAG: hypothetical protein EHM61_24490, partial [Acidobacteria bacterium]